MQENNSTQAVPVPQPTVIQTGDQKPKTNSFLVVLLSILLFISVAIAGFFAYQTQMLINELTMLRNESLPTSISIPTAEPVVTTNLTEGWKAYTNTSSNYQIKYPAEWKVSNIAAGSDGTLPPNARYVEIGLGESKSGTIGIEELQIIPSSEEANLNTTKIIGNLTLMCNGKFTTDTKTWCWIKVPNQEKYLNIQVFKNADDTTNTVLDQILSTFKFIN